MSTQLPDDVEDEGTPESVPTKQPDATLQLTDDGIEMPEFLKGYIGDFTIRTPNVTGDFETTDTGLPDVEVYDGIFAICPDDGNYHGDLEAGMLGISTEEHRETVYEIDDQRTEDDDAA